MLLRPSVTVKIYTSSKDHYYHDDYHDHDHYHCYLGGGVTLRLLGEVGLGVHLELDGVALGEPHPVTGLAGVIALVVEVHVLDHQGLAVVVIGCPALRQCAAFLCPSVNKVLIQEIENKSFQYQFCEKSKSFVSEEQLGCCNPLRSDIKDYLTWQIGHKEDKHHPFQGELEGKGNRIWH